MSASVSSTLESDTMATGLGWAAAGTAGSTTKANAANAAARPQATHRCSENDTFILLITRKVGRIIVRFSRSIRTPKPPVRCVRSFGSSLMGDDSAGPSFHDQPGLGAIP